MKRLITYLSKKSSSLENGSGMTRKRFEIASTKSRKSLDSILSRFSLASLICLCMLTVGVGQMWGAAPTLSDLSFSTSGSVRIINEDFESLSTSSKTAKINVTDATAYGVFNKMYNNNTGNTYAIVSNSNGFSTKSLSLSAGSGSPLIASVTTETFGTVGAWRLKTTKTSYNRLGIYSPTDNNNITSANTRVYVQNNAGAITLHNGSSWIAVKTVTTDIIDICVIYNKSGSAKTYGGTISIANNTAHVYVNGTCVTVSDVDDTPKAFSISSSALGSAVFRVAPEATNGNKCYVDDVQVWNALPGAAGTSVTLSKAATTNGSF